jgi:hypothetical protein
MFEKDKCSCEDDIETYTEEQIRAHYRSFRDPIPNKVFRWEGYVDKDWGSFKPVFEIYDGCYTSGTLKYFQKFKGKKIKITIEIEE